MVFGRGTPMTSSAPALPLAPALLRHSALAQRLPVFVIVLGIIMVLFPNKATRRTRRTLLLIHASLLVGFLVLGARFGPFTNPDSGIAVSVGMIGVAAMAT